MHQRMCNTAEQQQGLHVCLSFELCHSEMLSLCPTSFLSLSSDEAFTAAREETENSADIFQQNRNRIRIRISKI